MPLFTNWVTLKKDENEDTYLWVLKENKLKRKEVVDDFYETLQSHSDDLEKIADDIAALGECKCCKNFEGPVALKERRGKENLLKSRRQNL